MSGGVLALAAFGLAVFVRLVRDWCWRRRFPWAAAVGIAFGGFVVFAVGFSDPGGVFGLLVGLDAALLAGRVLLGSLDVGTLGLGKR